MGGGYQKTIVGEGEGAMWEGRPENLI